MSVQCHYKYNNELHHFRMGEYRKTDDAKQACIIEFVLFSNSLNKPTLSTEVERLLKYSINSANA